MPSARSDFNLVPIHHTFTVAEPTVTKSFPIEGSQKPVDDAYLLIQVKGVQLDSHQIKINEKSLPNTDLKPAPLQSQAWLLWMDHIPNDYLKSGKNTITITRSGNDDFRVGNLVVNWREHD